MKKFQYSPLALLIALPFCSVAETPDNWAERNPISFYKDRALEDWRYVDNMSEDDKTLAERLKRIPVSEDEKWKASFSHNLRIAFDNRWDESFKEDNRLKNAFVNRYYFGADINYDDFFRIYGELRVNYSKFALGEGSPVDNGGTDIHQIFAEVDLLQGQGERLSAKLGRQEVFITNFQLGAREIMAAQGSWDGVSVNYMNKGKRFYAYYGEQVFPRMEMTTAGPVWNGSFDDEHTGNTSGGLLVQIPSSYGYLSLYGLASEKDEADVYSLGTSLIKRTRSGLGYRA